MLKCTKFDFVGNPRQTPLEELPVAVFNHLTPTVAML